MHHVTSDSELEAIVGVPSPAVRMKQVDTLDDGCRRILASSPLAGFGYRDAEGAAHTVLVGGKRGFVRVESERRISFVWDEEPMPARGGASFDFLLPGVGETLRLNGSIVEAGDRVVLEVEEAFVHCPRCILRSGLWDPPRVRAEIDSVPAFLAAAPFALVTTWNREGASDTSPRGDQAGFLRLVDERTLVIPDRRGNQRADTFHNLLSCTQIALAAIIPGRAEILQVTGTASITNDAALLAPMAIGGRAPQLGIVISIAQAAIVPNAMLRRLWTMDRAPGPDMMAIGVAHLARSKSRGIKAALVRLLARLARPLVAMFPGWFGRKIDGVFAKELVDEGYARGLRPRPARVVSILRETADAVTLILEDLSGAPFSFRAGQYFTLCLEIDGVQVRRAYSASSLPGAQLALTIKRVAGGTCSTFVNERLAVGARVGLLGPSGTFYPPPACRELVLIAGGSGITPMLSIARSNPTCRVTLVYGNRRETDIIFARAIDELASETFIVRHVLEQAPAGWQGAIGRLDPTTLERELPLSSDAHYFLCGPEPMIAGAQQMLEARGVTRDRIFIERFAQPQRTPRGKGRRLPMLVEQHGVRRTVPVAAGTTLLEAGLEAGIPMPFSCGIGNCGECRVKLVKGDVELDEPNSLTADERAAGYVLACCARPLTAVEVCVETSEPTSPGVALAGTRPASRRSDA